MTRSEANHASVIGLFVLFAMALAPWRATNGVFGEVGDGHRALAAPQDELAGGAPYLCPTYRTVGQEGGPVRAVAVGADRVWFGVGPRLEAWSTAFDAGSARVGRTEVLPGLVEDIVLRGDRAYVAAQNGGLLVVDIADAARPRVVARLALEGLAAGVRLDGDRAYVNAGWGGLHVVDISTPDAPREIGRVAGIVSDAAVAGQWAFVVSRNLTMVDVTDPANPVQRAKLAEWADAVELVDGVLYAGVSDDPDRADRRGQLALYDVHDPRRVRPLLGTVEVGEPVRDILPTGPGRVLLLTRSELVAVDATDPAHPRVERRAPVPEHYRQLAGGQRGADIAAAGSGDGLVMISAETLGTRAAVSTLGHAASIAALDDRWLLVEDEGDAVGDAGRLRVVDLANWREPAIVGALPLPVDQRALVASEGRAIVGHADGSLRVVDLADPAAPREVGRLQLAGRRIWALALAGDLVWVANDDRLRAVDVSDPAAPREVGSVKPRYGATDVAVDGALAYVTGPDSRRDTDFDRLHVVDISNPSRPVVIADTPVDGWNDGLGAFRGLIAQGGLTLYGVRGAEPPVWLGEVAIAENVNDKQTVGGVVLLALEDSVTGTGAMRAVDVSDPRRPRVLGDVGALAPVRDVAVVGGAMVLAAGDAGIVVVAPAAAPVVPTPAPQPTRKAGSVVSTVYLPMVMGERFGCP